MDQHKEVHNEWGKKIMGIVFLQTINLNGAYP